jgi:hypothetical protein
VDDQRIQRLEQRMEALMRALEEIQRRMRAPGNRGSGGDRYRPDTVRERQPDKVPPGRSGEPEQPRSQPERRSDRENPDQPNRVNRVEVPNPTPPPGPAR